jgi:hypothetical protein
MSISIVNSPPILYPVYSINGNPVIASSTLTGDTNLKFVFDLYVESPSTGLGIGNYVRVNRTKSYKNPVDYLGHYSPNKILTNYVSPSVNPFIVSQYSNTNSIRFYKIVYGEEFTTSQTFNSTQNTGGFLQLNFTSLTGVSVGDEVSIKLNNNAFNPQYNNVYTATSVSSTILILNCAYGSVPTSTETGFIDAILHLQAGSISGVSVYNGQKNYLSASTNFVNTFLINSSSGSTGMFLTNYPGEYRIGLNEPATLSFIESGNTLSKVRYITYNSLGVAIGNYTTTLNSVSGSQRKDIPTGTWNLSQIGATNNLTLSFDFIYNRFVYSYSVGLISGSSNVVSELRTYNVYDNSSRYCKVRFAFVHSNGGTEYISANMKQSYTQKIKRETIDKVLPYNYTVGDRSSTIINIDIDEQYTVYTDFLVDAEVYLIKELKNSYEVYILDTDNQKKIPVIITNTEFAGRSRLNNRLFNYRIDYKMAYDVITQYN